MTGVFDPASVSDVGTYLTRLIRLDPAALVRLRPAGPGVLALWAHLPFDVLVTRNVRAGLSEDATVRASELLDALSGGQAGLPRRRDAAWRWPLPPSTSRVAERLPAAELRRVGAAAAGTLREAAAGGVGGRAVGERMLRDALLDHVPILVHTDDGSRVDVPQRLVQAVARMGFLGPRPRGSGAGEWVDVRLGGIWTGLAAEYGTAWYRAPTPLQMRPVQTR